MFRFSLSQAGQGVNLGFADAGALASVLARGACGGMDAGDVHLLRDYERERVPLNLATLGAVHGLWQLFGATNPPLALARTLGMGLFNATPAAKAEAAAFALGLRSQ